jgi:hypothetical protein
VDKLLQTEASAMQPSDQRARQGYARLVVGAGAGAGLLSLLVLLRGWRNGRRLDWAGVNAPSHWLWGDAALRQDRVSLKYTGLGALTHLASSLFWAAGYGWLRRRHDAGAPAAALADAATVTIVAAVVDLLVVPPRLTPGFERRLSRPRLAGVYLAFAAGLALAETIAQARARSAR